MLKTLEVSGTPDELVARAQAMIPTLRKRSAETEALRRIPNTTWQDLRDAGLLRTSQSPQFGGFGYGIDTLAEVGMQIGRGDGSSAWMACQWPGHQFMVGYYPLDVQEEYWETGYDTMSSTASAVARLNMEPESDGWRIRDSQMRFSSGCDYADWIFFITKNGMALLPKSDFEVLDDWYVNGLRGTGSKSIVVKDAFVPRRRFITLDQLRNGRSPGIEIAPESHYLRAPFNLVLNQMLLGATIGMAQGVADIFEERASKRIDIHTMRYACEGSGTQLRFAESHAEIEAARMFLRRNCRELADWGAMNHTPDQRERAEARRNVAYATRLCVQSTQRLVSAGDASGMFDDQQLGRLARDVYMAGLQANLTWDEPAQSFARARWGQEPLSYLT